MRSVVFASALCMSSAAGYYYSASLLDAAVDLSVENSAISSAALAAAKSHHVPTLWPAGATPTEREKAQAEHLGQRYE